MITAKYADLQKRAAEINREAGRYVVYVDMPELGEDREPQIKASDPGYAERAVRANSAPKPAA
jgi:hypothetical protein